MVRMITRTIKTTKVTGLFVDVDTKATSEEVFTLACPAKTEQEIMKIVTKSKMFTGTKKLVSIIAFESELIKYQMSEQDFLKNATQIEK